MSPQYWVVGAMFGGNEDTYPEFIAGGYWFSGYSKAQQPAQVALMQQMRIGDRIAIKRMLGAGATEIEVRALGIIRHIEELKDSQRRFYVDWVVPTLQRRVPCKGAFATVQGPYLSEDSWTRQVFQL